MLWKLLIGGVVTVGLVAYTSPTQQTIQIPTDDLSIKSSQFLQEEVLNATVRKGEVAGVSESITPVIDEVQEVVQDEVVASINENEPQQIVPSRSLTETFSLPSISFELTYPIDWEFASNTKQSIYTGIKERVTTIAKGDTTITFTSKPRTTSGCEVLGQTPSNSPLIANINNSIISRYDDIIGDYYAPSSQDHFGCDFERYFLLRSTIPSTDSYNLLFDEDFITFNMKVTVTGTSFIQEADDIVVTTLKDFEGY